MSKGLSIHVGMAKLDRKKYEGFRDLPGAEQDAQGWCVRAEARTFVARPLINKEATLEAFKEQLRSAAHVLDAGDILLITFSGHGRFIRVNDWEGKVQRATGIPGCRNLPVEEKGRDATLCFYDGEFVDNEFYSIWCSLKTGVFVVLITDACGSGTVHSMFPPAKAAVVNMDENTGVKINQGVLSDGSKRRQHEIPPVVLHISASTEESTTREVIKGVINGKFTSAFFTVLDTLEPVDTYVTLYEKLVQEVEKIDPRMKPLYTILGANDAAITDCEAQFPLRVKTP